MRVLALGPESYGGFAGIAQGTRDFLRGLGGADEVEHVHLLARRGADGGPTPPDGITCEVASGSALAYSRRALQLASEVDLGLVFCLHVNLMPVAASLGRLLGLPTWLAIHGIDAWRAPSWITRWAISKARLTTASSAYTRERFLAWADVAPDSVVVNNNPVHLEEWGAGPKPDFLLDRYDLRGRRVLLTLGRMLGGDRFKGHDELLDVLPPLAALRPDVAWLIVGDGPDRARLEERVRTAGLSDRVVFAGRIPETEKRAHYLVADAYALPSLTEGFGIAYLEAAACGLPLLGSSRDGSRDALANGELGILVDPTDREELLDGLVRLLATPKGVRPAVERFAFEHMAARMRGLLRAHFVPSERVAA